MGIFRKFGSCALVLGCLLVPGCQAFRDAGAAASRAPKTAAGLARIGLSPDGSHFVQGTDGPRFIVWGYNYDHDANGRLIEDYWIGEWPTVEQDFQEMKALGANVIRVHLQLGRFMCAPDQPDEQSLDQLTRLLRLAEQTGLYLDLTGLGCYHREEVPAWYDAMRETERWAVQARFWEAVAQRCARSSAVFCYDLMNEPILPGPGEEAGEWLAGDFAGSSFVQRITLDLAGRTREQVARDWVERLTKAIRTKDTGHMITVGVIPWAYSFPGAQPVFYSKEAGAGLDFVSVHFYPETGKVDKALAALTVYRIGKPLLVEECAPLHCSLQDFNAFIDGSRPVADGYLGFYWGKTREQYLQDKGDLHAAIMASWLEYFDRKRPAILGQ